jgi:hypothetical protein
MEHYGRIELIKSPNGAYNLSHESVHFLEDFGIISRADTIILDRKIKRDGKWDANLSASENRAYFLADELNAPAPTTAAGKIWAKIKDFINKIRNLIGDRTAEGISREIKTGEIYGREAGKAGTGADRYTVGQKLRESDIPIDNVTPVFIDTSLNRGDLIAKAGEEVNLWPEKIIASDGSEINLKNPEHGSFAKRVKHLIWDNNKNILHLEKAKWLPNVPDTLENAAKRLVDEKSGNRIYVRAYQDDTKHMVVVSPKGEIIEQKPFIGSLITQFPYNKGSRHDNMKFDWERKGEGRFQENPNPSRTAALIPGSQQSGPEFEKLIPKENMDV